MAALLLFDFDGVIADSLDIFHAALARACVNAGVATLADRRRFLELFDGNMVEGLRRAGVCESVMPRVLHQLKAELDAGFPEVPIFSGMRDVLDELVRLGPVYIITSNHTAVVQAALERYGVRGIQGVLGADVDPSKVAKIRACASRHTGTQVFYVGDTRGDMREGHAAGAHTVAVSWGWHAPDSLMPLADHIAWRPMDLVALVHAGDDTTGTAAASPETGVACPARA